VYIQLSETGDAMSRITYLIALLLVAFLERAVSDSLDVSTRRGLQDLVMLAATGWALWIGAAYMRANNAGKPLWWGLIAGVPLVGLVAVIYLLVIPSKPATSAI
jgi:hypothetical protein